MLLSSETVASRPALMPWPPGGLKATPQTWSVWSVIVWTEDLIDRSQSLTVRSLDPVAKAEPSGLASTDRTQLPCPDIAHTMLLFFASYILTCLSSDAVKRIPGSTGEKTKDRTGILWPSRWCKSLPRIESKMATVPSIVLHARSFPSILYATASTNFPAIFSEPLAMLASFLRTERLASLRQVTVFQSFTATARIEPCKRKHYSCPRYHFFCHYHH